MLAVVKPRFSYYKKYGKDIWGFCKFCQTYADKRNRMFYLRYVKRRQLYFNKFRRYVFRIDIIEKKEKFKRLNWRFISIRLLRLYYIYIKDHQFRKIARKSKKVYGVFESNYCHFLESKLMFYLYRSTLFFNIFETMRNVDTYGIIIKKMWIKSFRYLVPVKEYVYVYKLKRIRKSFEKRIKFKLFHFSIPRYIYLNYFFCFSFIIKKPRLIDLASPIKIDIFRITGFY